MQKSVLYVDEETVRARGDARRRTLGLFINEHLKIRRRRLDWIASVVSSHDFSRQANLSSEHEDRDATLAQSSARGSSDSTHVLARISRKVEKNDVLDARRVQTS